MLKKCCSGKITGLFFKWLAPKFMIYGTVCVGFCLTLFLWGCQATRENAEDRQAKSEESIAKAEKLDAECNYEVARAVLDTAYMQSRDEGILRKWLALDKALLDVLNGKSTHKGLTAYEPPTEVEITQEDRKDLDDFVKRKTGGLLPKFARNVVVWAGEGQAKRIKSTWGIVTVVDKKEAQDVIDKYDILKRSQNKLNQLVTDTIIKAPVSMIDKLNLLLKDKKKFCEKVRKSRINYVSYDVVSPYLARTCQLIFISEQGGGAPEIHIYGHDEDSLRAAVKTMTMGCGVELVLTSNRDVRDQFLDTYSRIKKLAGKAELDELKLLGNFADSISDKSSKGNDLWWP